MNKAEAESLLKLGEKGVERWNARRANGEDVPSLHGATLRDLKLSGINFNEVNLNKVQFGGSVLEGAEFRKAHLEGAVLRSCDLQEADFRGAVLRGVDFTKAVLKKAQLSRADLENTNFTDADLSEALLIHSNLRGARFANSAGNSTLNNANLSKADLSNASFEKSVCDGARFVGAEGLFGRFQADSRTLVGAEKAIYSEKWDVFNWSVIRIVGSLPLFGVSYLGIITIWIWAVALKTFNVYFDDAKQLGNEILTNQIGPEWFSTMVEWFVALPRLEPAQYMGNTFIALLFLATGTTFYKLSCPAEIQESSETRWVCELGQPVMVYKGLAASRRATRWLTAFCYLVGGPWVIWLLLLRACETIVILFWK